MEKLAQELGSRSSMAYDSGPQKCGTVCLEECQTARAAPPGKKERKEKAFSLVNPKRSRRMEGFSTGMKRNWRRGRFLFRVFLNMHFALCIRLTGITS